MCKGEAVKTDDKILNLLKDASRRLIALQKEVLSEMKIKLSHYKVLTVLALSGEIMQTELSEICGIDKPATSRLVGEMSREDFVKTTMKEDNKKSIYVSLTFLGKQIAQSIKEKICAIEHKYFKKLNEAKKEKLYELLTEVLSKEESDA